jgi:hypothetical protein
MTTYEFWRDPAVPGILAIRLTDGIVSGWAGPLRPGDVLAEFLPEFPYVREGSGDLESRREAFEVLDEQTLLYLSTAAD